LNIGYIVYFGYYRWAKWAKSWAKWAQKKRAWGKHRKKPRPITYYAIKKEEIKSFGC
jgi:hypothetical protein